MDTAIPTLSPGEAFSEAEAAEVRAKRKARLDRELARLDEMAEMGMAIGRALTEKAQEPGQEAAALSEVALAFTRVARAVRQINAQEQKILELGDAVVLENRLARNYETDNGEWEKKTAGRRRVMITMRDLLDDTHEPRERERLLRDLGNDYDDLYGLYEGSIDDVIARICKDLGIAEAVVGKAMTHAPRANDDEHDWPDDTSAYPAMQPVRHGRDPP